MSKSQTACGKAFEYACIKSAFEVLMSEDNPVIIEDNSDFQTAQNFFCSFDDIEKNNFILAAKAAMRMLLKLEPQLLNGCGHQPLYLSIQGDRQGKLGDVRDIICIRKQKGWQIGLSCKHNNHAVKHSRLSDSIDFGKEWFDVACSNAYFDEIKPIFSYLRECRNNARINGQRALTYSLFRCHLLYIPKLSLGSRRPRI